MKYMLIGILLLIPMSAEASLTINLEPQYEETLQEYADANSVTIEEYTENILNGWAKEHIKGDFIKEIDKKTYHELKQFFKEKK